MERKFTLVEPHILEQLHPGSEVKSTKNILNELHRQYEKPEDEILKQTILQRNLDSAENIMNLNSPLQSRQTPTGKSRDHAYKHTCSYCGHTFVKKQHYRRHLAVIHSTDITGNPIDTATLQRYKNYNKRRRERNDESHKKTTTVPETGDTQSQESLDDPYLNHFIINVQQPTCQKYSNRIRQRREDFKEFNSRQQTRVPKTKVHVKKSRKCTPRCIKWINY